MSPNWVGLRCVCPTSLNVSYAARDDGWYIQQLLRRPLCVSLQTWGFPVRWDSLSSDRQAGTSVRELSLVGRSKQLTQCVFEMYNFFINYLPALGNGLLVGMLRSLLSGSTVLTLTRKDSSCEWFSKESFTLGFFCSANWRLSSFGCLFTVKFK